MIETARLILRPATIETLRAAIEGRDSLAKALGATVPPTWPHEYLDDAAFNWTIDALQKAPDTAGWWMYFVLLRGGAGAPALIGSGGYKGPPSTDGVVEIGYGIVEDQRRHGFAVEASRGLTERAFGFTVVQRVAIETLPELEASIRVARRLGMQDAGAGSEPGVIRFEMTREAWTARRAGAPRAQAEGAR